MDHDIAEGAPGVSDAEAPLAPPVGGPRQGARVKLGDAFLAALYQDWLVGGTAALVTIRTDRPHDYVRLVASVMPKEVAGTIGDDLSPELRQWLGLS